MATYTADAVSVLLYLVDALPKTADQIYSEAEAGEIHIQAPSTALAEVFYNVSRDKTVRGETIEATPEQTRQVLLSNGPLTVSPVGANALEEYTNIISEFSIHDALVVADHYAQDTEAIITSDRRIRDSNAETVWG